MRSLLGPVCTCRHGEGMHDIGARKADLGQRTACSVSEGPRGVHCDCRSFTPEFPTTTTTTTQEKA